MKSALKALMVARAVATGMLRTATNNDEFNKIYKHDPEGLTSACKELVEEEKDDCPHCPAKSQCNMYAVVHGTYGTSAHKQITTANFMEHIDKLVDRFYDKAIKEGKDPFEAFDEVKRELDLEEMIADLNIKVEE